MNWRLIFSGTQSSVWVISALVAILLAAAVIVVLGRYERRLVSRPVGVMLLVLRLITLFVLLLTMLQPVLTRYWDRTTRGHIVLAIDVSESMETQDRHATDGEKLRWAQALGLLGNAATEDLIDRWVAAYEAGNEPNWLGADGPDAGALGQSRRDAIRAALNEVESLSRMEIARRLLLSNPRQLHSRLSEVMPVDLVLFATDQESIAVEQISELLASDRRGLRPGQTDATGVLSERLSGSVDAGQLRGIVLLTDGRQTSDGDPGAAASRLGRLGVPVFTVPVGSRYAPRDLSIASLSAPDSVFLNDAAQINVHLGTAGFEGKEVLVRLLQNDRLLDQRSLTPAGSVASATFTVPSTEAGRFEFRIATDVQPGELRDDNNQRDFAIQVVDNKAHVMLLDGDARWEFRYLKNLLERDPRIELTSVLFKQPYLQLLNETFIASELPPLDAMREALARTDLLIVGDVSPSQVDEPIWTLIEQAVSTDGLTVLFMPGRRSFPQGFNSETLNNLLPAESGRQRLAQEMRPTPNDQEQSVIRMVPTSIAQQLPMFQLADNETGEQLPLSALPGHPWAYTITARPTATVWAFANVQGEDLPGEAVMASQDYGFGQVIWMGIDSTWRWRRRRGDSIHHQFWGQMIRWAARNRNAAGNDQVRLSLTHAVATDQDAVEAVVRWNPKLAAQLTGARVELVITRSHSPHGEPPADEGKNGPQTDGAAVNEANSVQPETEQQVIVLNQDEQHAERFVTSLSDLPVGAWKVQLRISDTQVVLKDVISAELLIQKQPSRELADVSCNRDFLQQLSSLSNGRLIEPYDLESLIELVTPQQDRDDRLDERSLWDHWTVLAAFFTLLMTEWCVRKLNGLP